MSETNLVNLFQEAPTTRAAAIKKHMLWRISINYLTSTAIRKREQRNNQSN